MCECGCVSNDERYTFPGPGKSTYVLVLHGGCINCVTPPGICIERLSRKEFKRQEQEESFDGVVRFNDWGDMEGVAVVAGHLREEFVKALLPHLVGVSSKEMGENGRIDTAGAEVILDEMYEDAMCRPCLIQAEKSESK